MFCGKCCEDVALPVLHMLFPTAYLDEAGLEFYRAHGLDKILANNENVEFDYGGKRISINILELIRPDVYVNDMSSQLFYIEHKLNELLQTNDTIIVKHRCQHLQENNACGIYDRRPQVCRTHDCHSTRNDCAMPPIDTHKMDFMWPMAKRS